MSLNSLYRPTVGDAIEHLRCVKSQFSNKSISGLTKGDVKQQWVALDDVGACAALALQHAKYKGRTIDLCGDELTGNDMAKTLTKLRAGSTGEVIVYKCAWFMRLFMLCLAGSIYQEKVEFQEKGGFAADRTGLRDFTDDYPEDFKRKGPMDFEKFLVRYGFEDRPLPAERGWGKMLVMLVCGIAAVTGLLVAVLPPAFLQDLQRRWAFYGEVFFHVGMAWSVTMSVSCLGRGAAAHVFASRSLHTLGRVLAACASKRLSHVPRRESLIDSRGAGRLRRALALGRRQQVCLDAARIRPRASCSALRRSFLPASHPNQARLRVVSKHVYRKLRGACVMRSTCATLY